MTMHKYAGTAEGVAVSDEAYHDFYRSQPSSELPIQRGSVSDWWYEVEYAFVVNGKTYYSLDPHCPRVVRRVPIHYDPHDPATNIRGSLTSPWPVLAFAWGIGSVLLLVGYDLARTGRQANSQQ
jgi:hypothetical protein